MHAYTTTDLIVLGKKIIGLCFWVVSTRIGNDKARMGLNISVDVG